MATDLEEELVYEVIMVIEELDGTASTHLGHALHLVASSFNSLFGKRRNEAINRYGALLMSWLVF